MEQVRSNVELKPFPGKVSVIGTDPLIRVLRSAELGSFGSICISFKSNPHSKANERTFQRHINSPKVALTFSDQKGGWRELNSTVSISDHAYIAATAIVMDGASVGRSNLYRNAVVGGKAIVEDGSTISSGAMVLGDACIANSVIGEDSLILAGGIRNSKLKRTKLSGTGLTITDSSLTDVVIVSMGLTVSNLMLERCRINGEGYLAAPPKTNRFYLRQPRVYGTDFSGNMDLLFADFSSAVRR